MELCVRVPGSCGELIQGYWQGQPFLVTCPIDWFSTASVSAGRTNYAGLGEKSRLALEKTLAYWKTPFFPFSLTVSSALPQGKGMASSSADIAAVILAVSLALGKTIRAEEIGRLAASIEPTDGIFYRGVVAMNYRTGQVLRPYGVLPPLRLAVFDLGGSLDTVSFHKNCDAAALRQGTKSEQALTYMRPPYTVEQIGRAATYSALLHQHVLYKPQLPALLHIAEKSGAAGVVVAHSGTVAGMLFPPFRDDEYLLQTAGIPVSAALSIPYLGPATLCSGGWYSEVIP